MGASRWRLGHSPCPATQTHTHIHSHSHTRSTSDTHTPAPAAFFTHPLAHLMPHTSLLTASRCACLANRVPSRQSGSSDSPAGQSALRRHPGSPSACTDPLPQQHRTPTLRGCALWAHTLLQNTHTRRHIIPFPRPGRAQRRPESEQHPQCQF